MGSAPRAQDPVSDGKARTAYTIPVTVCHYQPLPSALIRPKQPENLDSTVDIAPDRLITVDPQSGGPGADRYTNRGHGIVFADSGSAYHRTRWRSGGPDPTTRPIPAYGLIITIKANYFGKEFLRMAGIVQMLHLRKPTNDT